MSIVARTTAALALFVAGAALAQDIELFDRPDFGGQRLTLNQGAPDLGAYGMGGRASSVVVHRGNWEFCTRPDFRGACITVGPGRYGRLPAALNDSLASLRPAGMVAPVPPQPPLPPRPTRPEPFGQATIVLYAGDFSGPELRLFDAVQDLARRAFNDTATTIDVLAGQWELCSDGGYSGQCLRFGPGRHRLPHELRDRLSSLRPAQGGPMPPPFPDRPDRPDRPGRPGTGPWPGATPAVVLYENRDYSGRQLPLAGAVNNLNGMDFNDRASAVEIFRGRWQLCRHADFGGDCVVLGPGRYELGGRLQDAVSSLRPVFRHGDQPLTSVGGVTLHDQFDLRGRSLFVDEPVYNLRDRSFNDRTTAIEVHGGQWELCSASDFRGRCDVFGPGWHRLPPGLAGELSSLRPR